MFLSGLGVVASGLFAHILVRCGYATVQRKEAVEGILWYKRVLPVGLCHAGTLAFGNIAYLYLNVGFIQMLKSFTPVIIMLTGYMANIESPTFPLVVSVVVISLGTAITCTFSLEYNVMGLFIMFMSELTEAIKLIFTQFFLQQVKMGVIETQLVIAPASAFWLFLASAFYEMPTMYDYGAYHKLLRYAPIFLAAAIMGLGVNFLSNTVIQFTSSLTMKILNVARNVITILIGIVFYSEIVGMNEAIGYFIALFGFAGYNITKMGYFDPPAPKRPTRLEDNQILSNLESGAESDSESAGFIRKQ